MQSTKWAAALASTIGTRGGRSTITRSKLARSVSIRILVDSDPRTSLENRGAVFVAGKKNRLVAGSFQIASSRDRAPDITSTIPIFALGANLREREEMRRSQSTIMTRPPAFAVSCATAAAMVDFPSFGRADVNPMTLLGPVPVP